MRERVTTDQIKLARTVDLISYIFKISLIVVVLPEPFGPIKPIIYPFGKVKLILNQRRPNTV